MYLGIDLGTSNSAVAGFLESGPVLFKTPEGTDVMPSVIYRDRRGKQTVGVRAYNQASLAPDNVVQGFKRLMGTATPLRFSSSGQTITPEEASAELLRTMVGYAMVESGKSAVSGAAVTIPAAFNQRQSEATLAAAQAAGLDRVSLIQEPVAAALAMMAQSKIRSGQFLVYDIGGGTFDVALVQAVDGSVSVVAHEGINMLGGRDFDRLIVDHVVRPWLLRTFELPENFQTDKRYTRLIRVARFAAEKAKIDLSNRESAPILAGDEITRLEDGRGEPIYIDAPLDRRTVEELVDEKVTQSIALCRKVLDDNGYGHEDIERVVLVGGPTKMPIIRRRVQDELGIAVEDISRVDPMTAVAIGAAIYCESRDWKATDSTAKPTRRAEETAGAISVAYDYEARTASERARLTIRALGDPVGASVQVDYPNGETSGRLSLDRPVVLELPLPKAGPNRFQAWVFDRSGRAVSEASRKIVIERLLAATAGVPATLTIGVKVDDAGRNTLDVIVSKGKVLPASGVVRYRAAQTVRAGGNDAFRVELFQLSDDRVLDPKLNLGIGEFRIDSSDLPEGMCIRRGDEVLVHWTMSEGQTIKAEVELPSVGQRFDDHNYRDHQIGQQSFEDAEGEALVDDMLAEAEAELTRAESAAPSNVAQALVPLRQRLDDHMEAARKTVDPEDRRSITEEARRIRQDIALVCSNPTTRQQILRRDLDNGVRWYDQEVRLGAAAEDNQKLDALARNARHNIEGLKPESKNAEINLCEQQIGEIWKLYWRAGMVQPQFVANNWRYLRDTRHLARDRALFDRTVTEGDRALAAADLDSLRDAIFMVWQNRINTDVQLQVGERAWLMRA